MDSIKLFFVNVFLFVVFYQAYIIFMLVQDGFHISLPHMEYFLIGLATFVSLIVWMNISYLWFYDIDKFSNILARVMLAEIPFVILWITILLVSRGHSLTIAYHQVLMTMGWFLLLYPFAMYAGFLHGKVSQ